MSWIDLPLPETAPKAATPAAVTVACTAAGGRFHQALRVLVRPALLDGALPWLRHGAAVCVQTGAGEHTGMLRIAPGPERGGGASAGRPQQGRAAGHRPRPAGLVAAAARQARCPPRRLAGRG